MLAPKNLEYETFRMIFPPWPRRFIALPLEV